MKDTVPREIQDNVQYEGNQQFYVSNLILECYGIRVARCYNIIYIFSIYLLMYVHNLGFITRL